MLADKLRGQVVEQLGVRREFAVGAEVVHRGYQPTAKQMLPDAVGGHPRRERMIGLSQPASQFQAAALLGINLDRVLRVDAGEKTARH